MSRGNAALGKARTRIGACGGSTPPGVRDCKIDRIDINMKTRSFRPYLRIESPDERHFVWVKRPDSGNDCKRSYLVSNLPCAAGFADRMDKLVYISVERIARLDEGMYSIVFRFEGNTIEGEKRLVADLPDIMDAILTSKQIVS